MASQRSTSALVRATQARDTNAVQRALDDGANANGDASADAPILLAAWTGDVEIIELLLAAGADLASENLLGDSALTLAAHLGHADAVSSLLGWGADANRANAYGETALTLAAYLGHAAVVSDLLTCGAHVDYVTCSGDSALTLAARKGSAEVVEILLKRGANRQHMLANGDTALALALSKRHVRVVQQLLTADDMDVDHGDQAAVIIQRCVGTDVGYSNDACGIKPVLSASHGAGDSLRQLLESVAALDVKKNRKTSASFQCLEENISRIHHEYMKVVTVEY